MGDHHPDSSYEDDLFGSVEGQGACAFFAHDPDGNSMVVVCTYDVADDAFGKDLRDPRMAVRVRAGLRALVAARRAAGGEGFTPLPT